jgi:hypothetical protein
LDLPDALEETIVLSLDYNQLINTSSDKTAMKQTQGKSEFSSEISNSYNINNQGV